MLSRLLMLGANHRLATFFVLILATCIGLLGISKLRVDTGFSSLISNDDPSLPIYNRIAGEFGSDDTTVVYVRDAKLWSIDKLAALEKLHRALEGLPMVARVDDLFNLRSIRGRGGRIEARIILPQAPTDPADIGRARADAMANPLIVGHFVSEGGNATALLVSMLPLGQGDTSRDRTNTILEQALIPARAAFEEVFQVGPARINAELRTVLFEDLRSLGPLSAGVLVVVILILLRSGFAALVPVLTSALSIAWTFGMMGWAGIPLNVLSAMLPSLVVVIGSTEDTHLIAAYLQGLPSSTGNPRLGTTRMMLKHLGVPMLLTILTTTLGFASNIFSPVAIIRDFALAATFAILANGMITILLVPMLLATVGPRRTKIFGARGGVGGVPGVFVRVFGFANRRFPRAILLLTLALCAFFVYQLSKLYVTNDPLSYFQADRPLIRDIQRFHRDLSGMKVFYITLESDQDKAFEAPENITKLAEIQRFMEKQAIFDQSVSLADHLALVNREFHEGDPEYFNVPARRELVAQYLLFFHRRDLQSYVSHDFRRANIVVRHKVSDSSVLNRHIRELEEVAARIAGPRMKSHVVGENLMINAAAESLMVGQVKSLAILLGVIFLIMSIMFTSFKGGVIALIPNLIPIILMFGLMGLLEIPLNPGTAMVAVIAIGIAIDGTIHLLSRYNDLCRRTSDYAAAVHSTVGEEATPMVATTLALALGFGILLKSNFTLIAQFGALSAATMLFALFANLLVTPIIMARIRLVGLHQILALSVHKAVVEKSPLFADMSGYQMRKAILISELGEFEKGQLLVEQGTYGRSMYLILSGRVEVVRRIRDTRKTVAILDAGQVFGEIGYVRKIRRTADVCALSRVEVLRFDYLKLKKDLKFFPHIVANLNFNISCILGGRLADMFKTMSTRGGRQKS